MTLGLDFSFRLELLYDEAHVDYLQIVFYIYNWSHSVSATV